MQGAAHLKEQMVDRAPLCLKRSQDWRHAIQQIAAFESRARRLHLAVPLPLRVPLVVASSRRPSAVVSSAVTPIVPEVAAPWRA